MSMPPAGVVGAMDQDAVIQAQIDLELDNINLDDELDNINIDDELDDMEDVADDVVEEEVQGIPEELDNYIKRLQEQTSNFEKELEECDELIAHTDRPKHSGVSDAVIPYEDFNLLSQLAKESGCDIDQYKQQILLELEQDEDILHDDLADLLTDDNGDLAPSDLSTGQGPNTAEVDSNIVSVAQEKEAAVGNGDPSLPVAIERAVEQGIDPTEIPVSQELVPLNNRAGIQQMLREQLVRLENTYRERTERIKQEEAVKREKEETRLRQADEERQYKKQEIEKQEQKLLMEREVAEKQIKKEEEEAERQIAEQMKKFKDEMRVLEVETERQKAELAKARMDEEIRKIDKQHHSALSIQRAYRGYRTRKQYLPVLEERREERRKVKEECRIKEIEKEIEDRETKKAEEEEQKRLKLESEKRRKEEEKQRKEEEKRLKEEEKRKKKEEEERKKAEEKKRKEEEKQRLEEEKRRKKEEEKKRKEEEAERKREEKRLKEEEEKRRKEEEKLKKEEEKRKKEEEKQLKEQEKKRIEEELNKENHTNNVGILKEETNQKKTIAKDLSSDLTKEDSSKENNKVTGHGIDKENGTKVQDDQKVIANKESEVNDGSHNKLSNGTHGNDNMKESKQNNFDNKNKNDGRKLVSKSGKLEEIIGNVNRIENDLAARAKQGSSSEIKEGKSPRVPHPPLSPKKKQQDLNKDVLKSVQKNDTDKPPDEPVDCLPHHLEDKRISFIKHCLPWSKISNEPWKLKGVTSKKPLRRPSSAKKLSPLPEDCIVKAARVASLKQVTTVELCDLPGYSMSPLGQCWGLKYLSMTRCNLRLVEGLQQCKQLLYIDVKDNKIEYIDLKDAGSLQVLDMSNNCLTSVHGLDNCTNLRWLDISHNNITRLGGLETLRRLHTLKLSHNQLISTAGLGDTPTLQVLDVSANHLQAVEDIHKLCLLLSVDVSANNIQKIPSLRNQVLLRDILLTDNSITSLQELSTAWLPLLYKVNVSQNNIMQPENLENCLTMRDLDISGNQILDAEVLKKCVQNCLYLEQLNLEENPFIEEVDNSFYDQLHKLLPRLKGSGRKHVAVKPRCSFEAMCLSQAQVYTDMFSQLEQNIRNPNEKSSDLAHKCDSYFKFCDKTSQIAVEHRYAHEYGEVALSIPTAPITPRSGRPNSARKIVPKGETFTNPKDLFEKALQSSSMTSVVNSPNILGTDSANKMARPAVTSATAYSNPKDLFEQALKSSTTNSNSSNSRLVNGLSPVQDLCKSQSAAAVRIQAAWRGWSVRHQTSQQTKIWLAAITIQSAWRGYRVRKWYRSVVEERRNIDPELVEKLHTAATRIQAAWRGYWLRSKLLAALEYARFEDEDEEEDAMNLDGEDFDIDKFMDFNEDLLDNDWRPPSTPEIPANHPVLRKPPSGRPKIPPISTVDRPPSNPRRAWKNLESPMSDIQNPLGRIPRPPSSVSSGTDTHRTGMSKKEEKLSEEWGFKDSSTAHLMMQRAKKMKYNAERKKKISKLDPKQRLRLFQKLQEDAHINQPVHVPQRKTLLPRKEYFQAQQDEMVRKEQEKQEEYKSRASRIYEWLHMPVNNYPVTDSVINKGLNQGQGHRFASESNLPDVQMGKRVQLTSGPGSLELQSVDSMSNAGDQRRRFSVGSGSSVMNKLPPIQSSSAPTAKTKERMSWRNPKVNQSVGWGGGKKRGSVQ